MLTVFRMAHRVAIAAIGIVIWTGITSVRNLVAVRVDWVSRVLVTTGSPPRMPHFHV